MRDVACADELRPGAMAPAQIRSAAATAARLLLDPYLGDNLPFITYFVAIVFIAWRTSTPVAWASGFASWLAAAYLFFAPRFAVTNPFTSVEVGVGSIAYCVVTGAIIFIADRMRRAGEAAERRSTAKDPAGACAGSFGVYAPQDDTGSSRQSPRRPHQPLHQLLRRHGPRDPVPLREVAPQLRQHPINLLLRIVEVRRDSEAS